MNYLEKKHREYGNIAVGIVGSGLMGSSLLAQLHILDGFTPVIMASRRRESLEKAFAHANIPSSEYFFSNNAEEISQAMGKYSYFATTDNFIPATLCDVVVDCTGDTEAGTQITLHAIEQGVDVVSLNVEMDATVGPYLKSLAEEKGVVYSGTAGDEPGAIQELYEFATSCGFEVLVMGKGKNNELNVNVTPDDVREEALSKNLNPKMLTSFVDGTNTMIELNAVCNSTGFIPDVRGCHNFASTPNSLAEDICLKEEGGVLDKYGIVDFVRGIAPGVFIIVKTKSDYLTDEMQFLKMGQGERFAIYRPYHLTSLETPLSIIRAVVLRDDTISPIAGAPFAETVAVAKQDIEEGQEIDPIGGYHVYGSLETSKQAQEGNHLPIGIIVRGTKARRKIAKGEILTYDDVELVEDSAVVKARKLQNQRCSH